MNLAEKIENIKINLIKLKEENFRLRLERSKSLEEITRLNQVVEDNEKRIKELENKTLNLQIKGTLETEETNRIKNVIEELITEVDKGLELLKKQ